MKRQWFKELQASRWGAVLAVLALVLSACGGETDGADNGPADDADPAESPTEADGAEDESPSGGDVEGPVRLFSAAFPISSPIHATDLQDFFSAEGVEVSLRDFPSGAEGVEGFRAGQADMVVAGGLPTLILASQGGVTIVAGMACADKALIVLSKEDVQSAEDLTGEQVATLVNSDSAFLLNTWLNDSGVDPEEVELLNLSPADQVTALNNDEVAAAAIWEPFGIQRETHFDDPAHILADQTDIDWRTCSYLVAHDEFVSSNPNAVDAVLRAAQAGADWIAQASDDELQGTLGELYRLEPEVFSEYFPLWAPTLEITDKTVEDLSRQKDWALENGIIESDVNLEDVIADSARS